MSTSPQGVIARAQFRSDSSGKNHFASTEPERKALARVLNAFGLKEVYQPAHTCVRGGEQKTSSRIDRIYVSHSLPEKCVMAPETTLPPHPYPPGGDGMQKGSTEHFPVLLTFYPPNLERGARFKIPEWIATHPELHKRIIALWGNTTQSDKPGKNWVAFKKIIKEEARKLMKESRSSALDKASKLTLGISVYRDLLDNSLKSTSAETLASQDPDLRSALQGSQKCLC